jgi:hypothetical protein
MILEGLDAHVPLVLQEFNLVEIFRVKRKPA